MAEKITSSQNSNFKRWRSLLDSRGCKDTGQFLMSGPKPIAEYLNCASTSDLEILCTEQMQAQLPNIPKDGQIFTLDRELFQILDQFGTKSPLLVGRPPEIKEWKASDPPVGCEVLCPIGDPANLGALIRTCCALNVEKIVLLKEACHPYLPKVLRASSGLSIRAPLFHGPGLSELKEQTSVEKMKSIFALDLKGEDLVKVSWPKDIRLIVGEEGPGLGSHLFNKVTIPLNQQVESLNVAVATGIALFSYRSQNQTPQA